MAYYYFLVVVLLTTGLEQKSPVRLPAPAGGIRLADNFYMDRAEVANAQWLHYLNHLRHDSAAAAYRRALPDTTLWNEVSRNGQLERVYLRSLKYRFHPVVGISYEQAEAFNHWRSVVMTNEFNAKNEKWLRRRGYENYKVVFRWRLPTIPEWEQAAAGGLDPDENPYGVRKKYYKKYIPDSTIIYDSLGYPRPELAFVLRQHLRRNPEPGFNCIKTFGNGFRYGFYLTHPTPFFILPQRQVTVTRPNAKGFYDMIGNVAEMTTEKGVAKGGSWTHYMAFSTIRKSQDYTGPAIWLGFRSVCEVSLEPL